MTDPIVSVMLPCYDATPTLPMALASLRSQTFPDWECIVVDDGSTDDPGTVVKSFEDKRFRLITLPENRGRAVARQTALGEAKGKYLTFLDADDWLYPNKIEKQVDAIQRSGVDIVGSPLAILDEQGNLSRVSPAIGAQVEGSISCPRRPPFPLVSILMRMGIAQHAHYRPELRWAQDLDFFFQVGLGRRYVFIDEPLYAYSGYASPSREKMIQSLGFERQIFWSYRTSYPRSSVIGSISATLKQFVYMMAYFAKLERMVLDRFPSGIELVDQLAFDRAKTQVLNLVESASDRKSDMKLVSPTGFSSRP